MGGKTTDAFYLVDGMRKPSNGKSIPFARLADTQARSPTYKKLSDGAKVVFMVCKLCRQYHRRQEDEIQGDPLAFYFNRKIQQAYGLGNPVKVRKALVELVSNGFIEVVSNGWTTRTKTIYRFSDGWKRKDKGQNLELSRASLTFINGKTK